MLGRFFGILTMIMSACYTAMPLTLVGRQFYACYDVHLQDQARIKLIEEQRKTNLPSGSIAQVHPTPSEIALAKAQIREAPQVEASNGSKEAATSDAQATSPVVPVRRRSSSSRLERPSHRALSAKDMELLNQFARMSGILSSIIDDLNQLTRAGSPRQSMKQDLTVSDKDLADAQLGERSIEQRIKEDLAFCVTLLLRFGQVMDKLLDMSRLQGQVSNRQLQNDQETVDGPRYDGSDPKHKNYVPEEGFYVGAEIFFTSFYVFEFLARLVTTQRQEFIWRSKRSWLDLLALSPTLVYYLIQGISKGTQADNHRHKLGYLRLLRIVRLGLFAQVYDGSKVMAQAIRRSIAPLMITLFFLITVVMVFATAIFYAEPCYDLHTCVFTDIFNAGYYVMATVATVGYGNQLPSLNNPVSVSLSSLVMIFGQLYLAMPLAIVGINYENAWRDHENRTLQGSHPNTKKPKSGDEEPDESLQALDTYEVRVLSTQVCDRYYVMAEKVREAQVHIFKLLRDVVPENREAMLNRMKARNEIGVKVTEIIASVRASHRLFGVLYTIQTIVRVVVHPARRRIWKDFEFIGSCIALFPFYVELSEIMTGITPIYSIVPTAPSFFSMIHVLKAFRILKLGTHIPGSEVLTRTAVLVHKRLIIPLFFLFVGSVICGAVFFEIERGMECFVGKPCMWWGKNVLTPAIAHGHPDEKRILVQNTAPVIITDMLRSTWLALETITTVGYGDLYPRTMLGRLFAISTMIMSACYTAMPLTLVGRQFYWCYEAHSQDQGVRALASQHQVNQVTADSKLPKGGSIGAQINRIHPMPATSGQEAPRVGLERSKTKEAQGIPAVRRKKSARQRVLTPDEEEALNHFVRLGPLLDKMAEDLGKLTRVESHRVSQRWLSLRSERETNRGRQNEHPVEWRISDNLTFAATLLLSFIPIVEKVMGFQDDLEFVAKMPPIEATEIESVKKGR
ncbi:hypothetical protein Poli38472_009534 [Pythium oligandrum]|uniref:Ion transport domain-containing protein n=1 Tax=Pythium oligandrum TaxID=41045 RepID=A0A8K1FGU8_PYTOL|nr:hypothetical protein Poli38472_009534 [Pythium oligandrum]|eukprot:TMW62041.1 hypothetical protein Poli38472_009534 [Pythium oligandrum]